LDGLPLLIDESAGLTVDQIIARARRAHRENPLQLIVVDHLHIITLPGKNTAEELGVVSSKLKGLAKELHVPVLALAQLNRGLKDRTDKRPTMTDLRASGAIEQDADEIWFLHREDYYDKKTHLKGVVEMINAKHRNAAAGETVHLRNKFKYMRLEDWEGELPERDEPEPAKGSRGWKRSAPRGRDAAAGADK
jgi:replicative DNA helicase